MRTRATVDRHLRHASNSSTLEWAVRVGLIVYGVVHLLVAWLALQLAFGQASHAASQQGALQTLASQPLGTLLLWVVAAGFFALAGWQAIEAIRGHQRDDDPKRTLKRIGSGGRVVVYLVIGVSAVRLAAGMGSSSHNQQLTARLMAQPFGRLLVALLGLGVIVVAIAVASRGIRTSFTEDLDASVTSGSSGSAVIWLGRIGYVAKGFAMFVVGVLFVWAAATYSPSKAGGLDGALASLIRAGEGPWLLVIVALGIGAFGLFCFAWARSPATTT